MTHIQDPKDEKNTLCGEEIYLIDWVPYDEDAKMLSDCEDCLILFPIGNLSDEETKKYFQTITVFTNGINNNILNIIISPGNWTTGLI